MERTYIKDLKEKVGGVVFIEGFVQQIRDQGGIKFLILRDATGLVQIVVLKSERAVFDFIKELSTESVVSIEGKVKEEKQAPGGYEVQALDLKLLSKSNPELPIPVIAEKGAEEVDITKRFDWRWLDLRSPEKIKIFKLWTELEAGFRQYFEDQNFIQIYTPSFVPTPSETGSEVFAVTYFDRSAYLAQSPQFYKQMAMAAGFEKVFMVGPVFRAEPSYTTRHMTEFTGWDFEVSFIKDHHDIMDIEENMLVAGIIRVNAKLGLNISVPTQPFPRITMKQAKEKLQAAGVVGEKVYDLSPEEERELCRMIKEETGNDFVFVTDYSAEVRPFYHMRYEDNPEITKSFDLMYKGLEITTGAQREHRPEILKQQALEKGMSLEPLADYINFFTYGCPPHGGAGIGPGRIIMRMLELASVKEATFLPRDVKRIKP